MSEVTPRQRVSLRTTPTAHKVNFLPNFRSFPSTFIVVGELSRSSTNDLVGVLPEQIKGFVFSGKTNRKEKKNESQY